MMTCKELNRAQRAERSYPKPVQNNTPAWLAFFVGLVLGIGFFVNWSFTRLCQQILRTSTATAN